jgi:hypothetical protein
MLFVIHGSDTEKVRVEARKFVDVAKTREPDLVHVRVTADTWDFGEVVSYISAQGLFVEKVLVALDGVFEGEAKEEMLSLIKDFSASNNVFLLILGDAPKTLLTKLEKHAAKIYTFHKKEEKKDTPWNVFEIGNAWEAKNPLKTWIAYHEARARGIEGEVLLGILHATIRRGLEKGSKTRSKNELLSSSREVLFLYHAARRGEWELNVALEHFLTT